jgi:hypothetical protein
MPDYDLTPAGGGTTIRLYEESLDDIPRQQAHGVERHGTIAGGAPTSDSTGLEPGEIRFRGHWLGADAAAIADAFQTDILDDSTVERVDVQAVDDSGAAVASRYNGTYRIADETRVDRVVAQSDANWRYSIILIEDQP